LTSESCGTVGRSFPQAGTTHEVKVNFKATMSGKLIAMYVPALTHMRN